VCDHPIGIGVAHIEVDPHEYTTPSIVMEPNFSEGYPPQLMSAGFHESENIK
jgi:hypothetical protein